MRVCIIYSTVDGQTKKICESLRNTIQKEIDQVDLFCISQKDDIKVESYDKIIIGASVRYGYHRKNISHFIKINKPILEKKETAFFSVNLVARKKEKCSPEANPYLLKFFKTIDWKPNHITVFAGVLDYPNYSFFDALMIKLIMRLTKGPTSGTEAIEYTDWEQVKAFGKKIIG